MKESPRSKLLQYRDGDNINPSGNEVLHNIYKIGLWETYFFYFPSAYIGSKEAVDQRHSGLYNVYAVKCWGLYFGIK